MKISTQIILASTGVAIALVALFGFILPWLVSAKSTLAAAGAAGLLIGMAMAGIILIRNVLGMDPESEWPQKLDQDDDKNDW